MSYQIKMLDKTVHDLVNELTAVTRECVNRLGRKEVWPLITDAVFGNCRQILEEHVVSGDFCGMQTECDESLTPALPQTKPMPTDPNLAGSKHVHRYVLRIDLPLNHFITLFVAKILGGIHQKVDIRSWGEKLGHELQSEVKGVMSKYLYESANCGMTDLCRNSQLFNPFER